MRRVAVSLVALVGLAACGGQSEPLPTLFVIPTLTPSEVPAAAPTLPPSWTPEPVQSGPPVVAAPAATESPLASTESPPARDPSICYPEDADVLQEPFYALSVDVFTTAFVAIEPMGNCQQQSLGGTTSILVPPADIQQTINIIQGSIANSGAIEILPCADHNRQAAIAFHKAALEVAQARQRCDSVDAAVGVFEQATTNYIGSTQLLQSQVPELQSVFDDLDSLKTSTDSTPPTVVPGTFAEWPGCPNKACNEFQSCNDVLLYLEQCPQWWADRDSDSDGIPCESLCAP